MSPTTLTRAWAPGRPSSSSSSARTRDIREKAASAVEIRKATRVASTAAVTSPVMVGRARQALGRPRVARKVSSSWRCSSNISFSSSGSAWS